MLGANFHSLLATFTQPPTESNIQCLHHYLQEVPQDLSPIAYSAAVAGQFTLIEILVNDYQLDLNYTDQANKKVLDFALNDETKNKICALMQKQEQRVQEVYQEIFDPKNKIKKIDGGSSGDLLAAALPDPIFPTRLGRQPPVSPPNSPGRERHPRGRGPSSPELKRRPLSPPLKRATSPTNSKTLQDESTGSTLAKITRGIRNMMSPARERPLLTENRALPPVREHAEPLPASRTFSDPELIKRQRSNTGEKIEEKKIQFVSNANDIIAIYNDDDIKRFRQYLLDKKAGVNDQIEGFERTYIDQALICQSEKIFLWLIKHWASLPMDNFGHAFGSYLRENEPYAHSRIQFLENIQEKIFTETKKIAPQTAELAKLEATLKLLWVRRLVWPLPYEQKSETLSAATRIAIFKETKCSQKLIDALMNICNGNILSGNNIFEARLKTFTQGILFYYHPLDIMEVLSRLYPYFNHEKRIICHYLLYLIIRFDNIHYCYRSGTLSKFLREKFFPLLQDNDFASHINELIALMSDLGRPLQQAYFEINKMLNRYASHQSASSISCFSSAALLADELRAISLEYAQTIPLKELRGLAWSKEDLKYKKAIHVVAQQNICNKLSQFLTLELLNKKSNPERLELARRYLEAIHLLTHETYGDDEHYDYPDVNSAMILKTALDSPALSRLPIFSEVTAKLDVLSKGILSVGQGFKNIRALMAKPQCIPFLMVTLTYLTRAEENANFDSKIEVVGPLLLDFSIHQAALRKIVLPLKSTLLKQIENFRLRTSEEFNEESDLLSLEIEPRPIRIDTLSFESLRKIIAIYAKKQYPLRVFDNQKVWEDNKALEILFEWLRKECTEGRIDELTQIAELFPVLRELPALSEKAIDLYKREMFLWHIPKEILHAFSNESEKELAPSPLPELPFPQQPIQSFKGIHKK